MAPQNKKVSTPLGTTLEQIEYDPLSPGLTTLHRAGIAGILLHLRTMEALRRESLKEIEARFIPDFELAHDGRALHIRFTKESFYSLMRERYRASLTRRVVTLETHKNRQKKLEKHPQRYVYDETSEEGKPAYFDPRPSLQHFDVFKADDAWKNHTADSIWKSYYCIFRTQQIFKLPSEGPGNNQIDRIWRALTQGEPIQLKKQYYPTAFEHNLKAVSLCQPPHLHLLLHFWPLVAAHFTPVNIIARKDEKTGETLLRRHYQPPVVVVPDVTHAEAFVEEFIDYIGRLGDPPSGKIYEDARYVATPLEAPLAFFVNPRLARGARPRIGSRGAEVYVFKKKPKDKQPLVATVVNESLVPELLDAYRRLMGRRITSFPFRAVCVENLLAQPRQRLYEGFERLVDSYPLDLFVARTQKDEKARRFRWAGYEMARSLSAEFSSIQEKERNRMSGEQPSVPFLIWRVARNYIRWRACSKVDPPIDERELRSIISRKIQNQGLTGDQEKLLDRYNATVGDIVEKLFIDFRGRREQQSFADAFTETLFRAPQMLNSENAERLRPFYEGGEWESGRRLVLMAISAAGASATKKAVDDLEDADQGDSDADQPVQKEDK